MTRKSTETRRRHPGWVKVKFTITFLIKGTPNADDVLSDMSLALDPGGEEDNIFEPLLKDDMRLVIQGLWPMKPKSARANGSLAPLYKKHQDPDLTNMSVAQIHWTFPTSKAVSEGGDSLHKMVSDYLTSRETESNYLINGWLLNFNGVADL